MIENDNSAKDWLNNADMLTEALPYMQKYAGSIIVIKYGGNAMTESHLKNSFSRDIVLMKLVGMNPVSYTHLTLPTNREV